MGRTYKEMRKRGKAIPKAKTKHGGKPLPRCANTGKVQFPTQVSATAACDRRMALGFQYMRAYECKFCGGWHLTSQEKL